MRRTKLIPIESLKIDWNYNPQTGELKRRDGYDGFVATTGYRCIGHKSKIYSVHRVAWALSHNCQPAGEVDHINGNRSDNRLCNLRLVSSSEQNMNRRLSGRNKSGVKGVCWEASRRKWRATVGCRPLLYCARFDCLEDAEHAVKAARKRLCGKFTNHG